MNSVLKPLAISLAVASLFPATLRAQTFNTPTDTSSQTQSVIVTASRQPQSVKDVLADVTVIDRSVLDFAGQSSLIDILSIQPGVQLTSNGSYRSSSGVFLRGASSTQTVVLIDGVRIGSATSGAPDLSNIPLDRIERIEILRGAASALYGPDAVGGVIQIFTREPELQTKLSTAVGMGSDGQRQANAGIRATSGIVGYSFGVSSERADGISVIKNPASSSYNADADGFRAKSANAKAVARLSTQHSLTLGLLYSDTRSQFDGTPFPNPIGLNKSTSNAYSDLIINSANVQWQAQWLPQWKSIVLIGTSDEKSVSEYFRYSDAAFGGRNKFNTQRKQATWQNDVSIGTDVLSFALEQRREAVDSTTRYVVEERRVNSVLASYSLNLGSLSGLAVARKDDNSQFGAFNNWSLSAGYKLTDFLRVVGNVGTSFQAPSFNQLYFPGFGNSKLQPQRNRSNEVGLKYQQSTWQLGAVIYRNVVNGFIDPVSNLQSNKALLRGATLSASTRYGTDNYTVSYDYTDPRSEPNEKRLLRISRNSVSFRAQRQYTSLNAFVEAKFASDREDNNLSFTGRDNLAGYALLNIGATWQLAKNWRVLGRVNNITDTRYSLANAYSAPGRNVLASVSWLN
jgi:vitamin B12 transporter